MPVQNSNKNLPVTIVHLIWVPYGIGLFERFISSYSQYQAGYAHQLVFLFNGVNEEAAIEPYLAYANEHHISYANLVYPGACQDIDAYYWAAAQLNTEYLLFFNSYATILAHNWLQFYMQHASDPKIGIVGATGSWQSYSSSVFALNKLRWDAGQSIDVNYRKYKLLIKAFFYWRLLFPSFPNPHVRTNSFLISRELMLSLRRKPIKNKFQAYLFESGRNSLSRQVQRKGLSLVITDRRGARFGPEEWKQSGIYWIGAQQNLLVADNQTMRYASGDPAEKKKLTYLAWGE